MQGDQIRIAGNLDQGQKAAQAHSAEAFEMPGGRVGYGIWWV